MSPQRTDTRSNLRGRAERKMRAVGLDHVVFISVYDMSALLHNFIAYPQVQLNKLDVKRLRRAMTRIRVRVSDLTTAVSSRRHNEDNISPNRGQLPRFIQAVVQAYNNKVFVTLER